MSAWTVVFTAGHSTIQSAVDSQTCPCWSQRMHHHQSFPALECRDCLAAPGEGLPTPWLRILCRPEKRLSLSSLTAFNNVSAARPEERKKSLKEIWKLTSEAPWEIRGTNTWLFSFCPTLYWDDRTGWFVLKGGSYWDMFLFGTFMSSLEDFDWNT